MPVAIQVHRAAADGLHTARLVPEPQVLFSDPTRLSKTDLDGRRFGAKPPRFPCLGGVVFGNVQCTAQFRIDRTTQAADVANDFPIPASAFRLPVNRCALRLSAHAQVSMFLGADFFESEGWERVPCVV